MVNFCFKKNCEFDAEYACLCLASETYSCKYHIGEHLKLPNRTHFFDSILEEYCEWTKDAILTFLTKEKSKKEKLKEIIQSIFGQNSQSPKNRIEESLKNLDSDLKQLSILIEMISQFSQPELSPLPGWLILQLNANPESMEKIPQDSDSYSCVWLFCMLHQLRKKKSEILNRVNIDPETEENFKRTYSLYKNYSYDPLISQTLQELINGYQRMKSLYLIDVYNKRTNLFIYDTVNEREETRVLNNPRKKQHTALITRLPNGELFFIGEYMSTFNFIIDRNYHFWEIPLEKTWARSSAIYFNRSIYCFGGYSGQYYITSSSSRFDLDENRWIQIASMPDRDWRLSCAIFNKNIVLSGYQNKCLFLYSPDIDSFSKIPIDILDSIRKVLIKAENRLYLIEIHNYGSIYESEVGDEYTWKLIGKSRMEIQINQVYYSYSNGDIYVSTIDSENVRQYFKFNLVHKSLIDFAYYNNYLAFRKLDNKLEAIDYPGHTFKFNPSYTADYYFRKEFPFYILGKQLKIIESCDKLIELDPNDADSYIDKGYGLHELERNIEAIECFDKAIELSPEDQNAYIGKRQATQALLDKI